MLPSSLALKVSEDKAHLAEVMIGQNWVFQADTPADQEQPKDY